MAGPQLPLPELGGVRRPRAGAGRAVLLLVACAVAAFVSLKPSTPDREPAFLIPGPGGLCGVLERSGQATVLPRVVCQALAGADEKPGGPPVLDDTPKEAEPFDAAAVPNSQQVATLLRDAKFLKTLKGKFVRVGAKPWDPHLFTNTEVTVQLEVKQAQNTKILNQVIEELRRITAVHPDNLLATMDNNTLGVRKGQITGLRSIIRARRNIDFLNRLNMIVLPRVRDFEGLYPNLFTQPGVYELEIPTQESFRELDELIDDRELVHPFLITIKTNCYTDVDAQALMQKFGFPFNPQPKSRVTTVASSDGSDPNEPEWMKLKRAREAEKAAAPKAAPKKKR